MSYSAKSSTLAVMHYAFACIYSFGFTYSS